jgi:hypothetical protein
MNVEAHPILRDAATAMRSAIVYHEDPLASVIAQRLITLEAKYDLGGRRMVRAYGEEWESLLGLMRLAETITPEEEALMSERLELRHRRLLAIGRSWLIKLDREPIVRDVFEDIARLARPDVAERTMTALRGAAVAGMLHRDVADDAPFTSRDEFDITTPIRAVLISRGVNL